MKKEIHPEDKQIKVTCTCGATYTVDSTLKKDLKTDLCRSCHPAWTKSFEAAMDRSDMISRYKEKMKKVEEAKSKLKSKKSK